MSLRQLVAVSQELDDVNVPNVPTRDLADPTDMLDEGREIAGGVVVALGEGRREDGGEVGGSGGGLTGENAAEGGLVGWEGVAEGCSLGL